MDKKKKYSLISFFGNYFDNLWQLTVLNLLFSNVIGGVGYLLYVITLEFSLWDAPVMFLLIPVMSPLFAGLFDVCRRVVRGDKIRPLADLLGGIKVNAKVFIVNSILMYVVSFGLFLTFSFYRGRFDDSAITVMFVFSIILLVFVLFSEFSLLTMTVSVELKTGDLIRNSVVLVVVGFWDHIRTVFSFLFVSFIAYLMILLSHGNVTVLILLLIIASLILPVLCVYIIVFNSYRTIERVIIEPFANKKEGEKSSLGRTDESVSEEEEVDIGLLEKLAEGDDDEYVYLNGRMVRRKTIKKMLENKKQNF